MVELALNVVLGIVTLIAIALLITYWMETTPPFHQLEQTERGLKFYYRLGVYRGTVALIRAEFIRDPIARRHVTGWSCYFPKHFSDKEMCLAVADLAKFHMKVDSHSKDLLIFDEIVNKNHDVECVLGKLCKKK